MSFSDVLKMLQRKYHYTTIRDDFQGCKISPFNFDFELPIQSQMTYGNHFLGPTQFASHANCYIPIMPSAPEKLMRYLYPLPEN